MRKRAAPPPACTRTRVLRCESHAWECACPTLPRTARVCFVAPYLTAPCLLLSQAIANILDAYSRVGCSSPDIVDQLIGRVGGLLFGND